MEWQNIKEAIVQFLTDNPEGKLKKPNIKFKKLEKIESQVAKEYINDQKKLLSVDKKELILSLNIKSSAGTSIVNNIYDILNSWLLKSKSRK